MKKIVVKFDEYVTWNEILGWFEPLKFASNLTGYNFGEELPRDCESSFEAFKEFLKESDLSLKDVVYMPVYAYIHGDIAFSTGCFCDPWDSGVAGYIWTTKKEYAKIYGYKRFTKKLKEKFEKDVKNLVKDLNANCYVVELYDNGEFVDSLGGLLMKYFDEAEVYQFAVENFGIKDKEIIIEFETEKYVYAA